MAQLESDIRTLLNPVKDPEKSFSIDIATTLQNFIDSFVSGNIPPNFNSAALLLQGSSSVYCKKVEYLFQLASRLQDTLKPQQGQQGQATKTTRERTAREKKIIDAFSSIDVKVGKNLSCLKKKNATKSSTSKKVNKNSRSNCGFSPVGLLKIESEDKEEVFYDTRGDVVGNKSDYTINHCTVTASGWILLPSVNPDLIPVESSDPDYTVACASPAGQHCEEDNICHDDDESAMPQSSPGDEGCPQPSADAAENDGSVHNDVPNSQSTDEGLGSLPCTPDDADYQVNTAPSGDQEIPLVVPESPMAVEENDVNVELENIPVDDTAAAPKPRRSMRNALKVIPADENTGEKTNGAAEPNNENAILKKKIEKKNTRNLPSKLKAAERDNYIKSAPEFCARTFFSLDGKVMNLCISRLLDTSCFRKNAGMLLRVKEILDKSKKPDKEEKENLDIMEENDDELNVDRCSEDGNADTDPFDEVNDTEQACDAVEGDLMPIPLEAGDIVIQNDAEMIDLPPSSPLPVVLEMSAGSDNALPSIPPSDDPSLPDEDPPPLSEDTFNESFRAIAEMQVQTYMQELQQYVLKTDLSERVYQWQKTIHPFLERLKKREAFDINSYGARILNVFEDSNRKQTIVFRDFCKGKEKWEIHRYFMALLPLVNVGNVTIETEARADGDEDILITILSRKMHHKELEEFGHNDGEHE